MGPNNGPELDAIAWYGGNSSVEYEGSYDCSDWTEKQFPAERCGPHPVGGKTANDWELRDMLGNVWEWTGDWKAAYPTGAATDPTGPDEGARRVLRGGSWSARARRVRAAYRGWSHPGGRDDSLGFRLSRGQTEPGAEPK